MKHTDSQIVAAPEIVARQSMSLPYPAAVVLSFALYPVLASGIITSFAGPVLGLAASAMAWVLAVHLIFSMGWMSYQGLWRTLFIAGVCTSFLTVAICIATKSLFPFGQWVVILVGGAVFGRRLSMGRRPLYAFIEVAAVTAVIMVAQLVLVWAELNAVMQTVVTDIMTDWESSFRASGYGADAIQQMTAQITTILNALVHLLPSLLVMGALTQLTVGFMVLMHVLSRRIGYPLGSPFAAWKAPFLLAPFIIIAVAMRFIGIETATLIGDNLLAVLSVCYCVGGLALIESYFVRARFGTFAKTLFYIALFFTQLIGFAATAFLGFVDSFVDFRSRRPAAEQM